MSGGFLETRTRVSIFLPHKTVDQRKAFLAVLRYLESQRTRRTPVTGYTTSSQHLDIFKGAWWGTEPGDPPESRERWVGDWLVKLIIDYEGNAEDCEGAIGRFRAQILKLYEDYGTPQSEIWIVAQPVRRYVAGVE